MQTTKLYAAIYVVLFAFATIQVLVEEAGFLEEAYWMGLGVILVLSLVKALFVVGYYQHLRFEPRSLTYLVLSGLVTALALTIASSYSIT